MIKSDYIKMLLTRAKRDVKIIVLPEGEDERVLEAAHIVADSGAARLIVLGNEKNQQNILPPKIGQQTELSLLIRRIA